MSWGAGGWGAREGHTWTQSACWQTVGQEAVFPGVHRRMKEEERRAGMVGGFEMLWNLSPFLLLEWFCKKIVNGICAYIVSYHEKKPCQSSTCFSLF